MKVKQRFTKTPTSVTIAPSSAFKQVELEELFIDFLPDVDENHPLQGNYMYAPRNMQNVPDSLDDLFERERIILIEGATGVGKTREMLELLKRKKHRYKALYHLKDLEDLPTTVEDLPKFVLIVINDLHLLFPMFDDKNFTIEAIERFQKLREFHRQIKGKVHNVWIVATVRSEQNEFARLNIDYHKQQDGTPFWYRYELQSPHNDNKALSQFLKQSDSKFELKINDSVRSELVEKSETFQGLIDYLPTKREKGKTKRLSLDDIQDYTGQHADWVRRYENLTNQEPLVKILFAIIAQLRTMRVPLLLELIVHTLQAFMTLHLTKPYTWDRWERRKHCRKLIEQLNEEKVFDVNQGVINIHDSKLSNSLSDTLDKAELDKKLFLNAVGYFGRMWRTKHELDQEAQFYLAGFIDETAFVTLARKAYEQLLKHHPSNAIAHNNFAILLTQMDDFEAAKSHYLSALNINPDYAIAHNNFANLLTQLKDFEAAKSHYLSALNINPDYANAHFNFAILLTQLKDFEAAKSHYLSALNINPDFADAHNNLAILLEEMDDFEAAKSHYLSALNINPDFANAHNNLAILLEEMGDLEAAQKHFDKAIELDPSLKERPED